MQTTAELRDEFIEALMEKQRLKYKLKQHEKKIGMLDAKLTERMDDEEHAELTTDDGLKLTKVIDETFALDKDVVGEDVDWNSENSPWLKWLHENNLAPMIKTKEEVHWKTRDSFFKKRCEAGENLPPFVKKGTWKHVKYNKAEIKRRVEAERNENKQS
jgi:hypothetical protein